MLIFANKRGFTELLQRCSTCNEPMKIWLADLTYTQQTIASDVIPAAIGMIAEYAEAKVQSISEIRLFKYPEDLAKAFSQDCPDVMGFSNYCWNSALTQAFAHEIKQDFPDVVTVAGGPNFPWNESEQKDTLKSIPDIDYYLFKEAEVAFTQLIEALIETDLSGNLSPDEISNLAYLDSHGKLVTTQRVDRVMDLEAIPSPYLSGRLDEFFDGRLLPVIQTVRGCPFTCTFCTEGQLYWSKVRRKSDALIRDEIIYIAEHLALLPQEKRRTDLLIADSNFGMFPQDLDTCRVIAEVQKRFDYPKYINVATGKNKKERVLEAARMVHGAMKLAGSVQSLDPEVQANMKRKNISSDQIVELAMQSSEIGANTYSEVILALPGDSVEAHFSTLKALVDSGFNTIAMYQLMILAGTEMGAKETKKKYGMDLKYRVIPRCFGTYSFRGRALAAAEIEEVCVANDTLPFEDYLKCRKMNLIVNLFFNDGVFAEIIKLLKYLNLSPWGWLMSIYDFKDDDFANILHLFLRETEDELWDSHEELNLLTRDAKVITGYIEGDLGSNLMFKYKALAMTSYFPAVCRVALSSIREYLGENFPDRHDLVSLVEDIIVYKRMQLEGLFDGGKEKAACQFNFDVPLFANAENISNLALYQFPRPQILVFKHSDEQQRSIESYIRIFGNDVTGLTRILSRVYLKQLFRQPACSVNECH